MATGKTSDPTAEQAAVIASTEPRLVVRAAAGAGKTRVLVDRYIKHVIVDGLAPDQILTITFTKKAAAEMKERIVDALRRAGLADQAQRAETGPIQTIHGFCERLLRENSLAAGLDPEFEIIVGAQAARLMEDSIRQALAYRYEDSPHVQKLIADLAGRRSYNDWHSPHSMLSKSIRDMLHVLRPTGWSPQVIEDRFADPNSTLATWRNALLDSLPADVASYLTSEDAEEPLATRLIAAHKEAKVRKPKWLKLPSPEADEHSAEHTAGLVQIAARAWRIYERGMERRQALDFAALESRAVKLVQESEQTRTRVQKQYRVALVDEAQDVNPVQYRLLESLGIETVMLVGDVQQSIYGFRQADVELFRQRTGTMPSERLSKNWRSDAGILGFVDLLFGRVWPGEYTPMLNGNKEIDLEKSDATQILFGVEFWHQQAKDTFLTAQWISQIVDELPEIEVKQEGKSTRPATKSDVAILVRRTKYALELLPRLQALGIAARIAGGTERFYTRLEVRDLANALRALADPHDDFALLATLRSPLCGLSLDSIVKLGKDKNCIDRLDESKPLLGDDESVLDEFRRWFLPLKEYADRLSAWEVLSQILAKTSYLDRIARRDDAGQLVANVRKLLMLASQEPDLGPLEYAVRLEEIQSLQHPEGDAPATDARDEAVTIMTIHKAKGLEFPIVVVPETHWAPASRSSEMEVDPWLGLVSTRFDAQPSMFHSWLESRRHDRDEEEEMRVLYVAMTRAKHRLCICLHPKTNQTWIASRICRDIGYKDESTRPPGVKVRE